MKRNEGKYTDSSTVKINILKMMHDCGAVKKVFNQKTVNKSAMGYAGFPTYNFKWPQGAAFSIAKIARELEDEGLISYVNSGYYATNAGIDFMTTYQESAQ